MPPRPLPRSLALIAATIALGLAVRLLPLGLPGPVTKYAGSILWAAMIFWITSTLLPTRPIAVQALLAAAIAAAVELFKLHHTPALDAFRLTLPGALLLGRFFSLADLLAYALAILTAALLDRKFFRRP